MEDEHNIEFTANVELSACISFWLPKGSTLTAEMIAERVNRIQREFDNHPPELGGVSFYAQIIKYPKPEEFGIYDPQED